MNTTVGYTNTIDINAFANLVLNCNEHISALYTDGAQLVHEDDVIMLYRKVPDSTYNLLKKDENGEWGPYYKDDKISIEFTDHYAIMVSVKNRDMHVYDDFKFPLTYVPKYVDMVYDWIVNGAFKNAMVNKEDKYTINIKNKDYKEISIIDHNVCEDDPGEIMMTICDIIDVDTTNEECVVLKYRASFNETFTVTLNYKEN